MPLNRLHVKQFQEIQRKKQKVQIWVENLNLLLETELFLLWFYFVTQ